MNKNPNHWILVADGACSNNPGPGGYGTIIVVPERASEGPGGTQTDPEWKVIEFGGYESETTNNRMELMGFYRGLQEIYRVKRDSKDVAGAAKGAKKWVIKSILDSSYVLDGSEKYVWSWAKNGWQTQAGKDVKNQDIWEKIMKGMTLLKELGAQFEYQLVKGHSGNELNERVDQISVAYSMLTPATATESPIALYNGPLKNYPVRLDATSYTPVYLSYANGVLNRHKTWGECEAFVKGKTGVKYKKVTNRLQEEETLRLWNAK